MHGSVQVCGAVYEPPLYFSSERRLGCPLCQQNTLLVEITNCQLITDVSSENKNSHIQGAVYPPSESHRRGQGLSTPGRVSATRGDSRNGNFDQGGPAAVFRKKEHLDHIIANPRFPHDDFFAANIPPGIHLTVLIATRVPGQRRDGQDRQISRQER